MFVDQVEVQVKAGAGGDGIVSFRREKHVPRGGPDGGYGGDGGSVVLVGESDLTTLLDFRYQSVYKAARGGVGQGNDKSGKKGESIALKVPVGTQVWDLDADELLADIVHHGQRIVVAQGGKGGRGNPAFVSSTHQTPRFAEKGEPAEERHLRLELKLLADVGLIGFPNVGKSTLISRISACKPKIADYPFTTLVPNLGVVAVEPGKSFVAADIPGLIEGASEGAGLGHQFLRHVERTRVLVHLLDLSGLTMRDPHEDFEIVNRELSKHSERLAALPQLIVLNKCDMPGAPELVDAIRPRLEADGHKVFLLSAITGEGVQRLIYAMWEALQAAPAAPPLTAEELVIQYTGPRRDQWEAALEDDVYVVRGRSIERLVAMTDLNNDAGVRRLQRILEKHGIVSRLRELGAEDGAQVRIGNAEFDFVD